jgi:Holliday junction DNA helicase RuvA
MIAFIEGKLVENEPTHVVIDVGGIGYHINISLQTFSEIKSKENTKLFTYLNVKEDSHTLYGFYTPEERKVFLHLISISGVGPSIGMMIQSSLSAQELFSAIVNEDTRTIQSVKGIGGKTAQRIILELKDKFRKEEFIEKTGEILPAIDNTLRKEALSALLTLGISKSIAENSVDAILKKTGNQITLEELIKQTLKST